MQLTRFKLFLTVLFFVLTIFIVKGQTCTGSLGDPVINETFGAGTADGTGPALPATVTNYTYAGSDCPVNGSYTIATSAGPGSCFGTWHVVPADHTGDPHGYMMIVDASYDPGIFYTKTVQGSKLCPNTTYEFAAWIANIMSLLPQTTNFTQPNITFTITTVDGRALAPPYNTGDIPESAMGTEKDKLWNHYGTYFTTPSDGADIVVTMTNNAPGGNGNDLILDDITFRPCGPVIQSGFVLASGTGDNQSMCAGQTSTYIINATQSGYNNPQFQWQVNVNGTGWADIPGKTSSTLVLDKTFLNAVAGNYQYRMGVLEGDVTSLNCRIYSKPQTIQVNPLPVATLSVTQSVCEGDPIQLTASGGATYQWSGPGLPPTTQNPVFINNASLSNSGAYTVVATSATNCAVTASATVTVHPKVVATVSNSVTICQGQGTTLSAAGGIKYSWTPSAGLSDTTSANPFANPNVTTTYTVKVSSAYNCFATNSVTVNVLKKPVANAGPGKFVFEGQSTTLSGSAKGGISNLYWTPIDYLDNPNTLNPVATPTNDITYTLHVISADGCGTDMSSVFVKVYKEVVIPNTFSPNNDGVNDLWNIDALVTYPGCLVTIFDRYGKQVYQSTGYAKPWDGTLNGSLLPEGTYYYIVDLKIGTPKRRGWVLLVR